MITYVRLWQYTRHERAIFKIKLMNLKGNLCHERAYLENNAWL